MACTTKHFETLLSEMHEKEKEEISLDDFFEKLGTIENELADIAVSNIEVEDLKIQLKEQEDNKRDLEEKIYLLLEGDNNGRVSFVEDILEKIVAETNPFGTWLYISCNTESFQRCFVMITRKGTLEYFKSSSTTTTTTKDSIKETTIKIVVKLREGILIDVPIPQGMEDVVMMMEKGEKKFKCYQFTSENNKYLIIGEINTLDTFSQVIFSVIGRRKSELNGPRRKSYYKYSSCSGKTTKATNTNKGKRRDVGNISTTPIKKKENKTSKSRTLGRNSRRASYSLGTNIKLKDELNTLRNIQNKTQSGKNTRTLRQDINHPKVSKYKKRNNKNISRKGKKRHSLEKKRNENTKRKESKIIIRKKKEIKKRNTDRI